ncbi:unnamed protein product [Urochloa decumbens]|uniref:KIB1-4 beta-propeller domain-containing protein n=1 Tax=Urochloa decumbens TaxID=240449 RepID=A0ABC9FFF5_9POAL
MDPVEKNKDSPPPLPDPSLAPALLFDGGAAGDASGGVTLYSIPKKRALPVARGFGRFAADASWVTPQGWVLAIDPASRDASLRDPFSCRTVRLPPDREGLLLDAGDRRGTTRCVLSTPRPTDPGCVVLVAHRERPLLFYCRPGGGDGRWFQHEYETGLIDEEDQHDDVRVTAVGGRFYALLLADEKVVALDLSVGLEPAITVLHVANSPWPAGCCEIRPWKVESCGELFLVRFCLTALCRKRVVRVEVDRLDWSKSAWVRAAGLGANRAFFVRTGQFGVSMAADEVGLKPNCIYFTNKDDKGLYVYDMEQGTTTSRDLGGLEIPDSTEPLLLMPAI